MLSLMAIGIPCSGPRTLRCARSRSSASASSSARGFSVMIAFNVALYFSMRSRYCCTSCRDVMRLCFSASCSWGIVASTTLNGRLFADTIMVAAIIARIGAAGTVRGIGHLPAVCRRDGCVVLIVGEHKEERHVQIRRHRRPRRVMAGELRKRRLHRPNQQTIGLPEKTRAILQNVPLEH